jgi:TetR/AcrR family transcriptional regulator, regulator of cefoperazone and chloramphenicol sensitivity
MVLQQPSSFRLTLTGRTPVYKVERAVTFQVIIKQSIDFICYLNSFPSGSCIEPMENRPIAATSRRRPRTGSAATDKGTQARDRLIVEATRAFAAKGYTAASTRKICDAADVNLAAIHYYFGDKEGLYRAVLTRPIDLMTRQFQGFDQPDLSFRDAISRFLGAFLTHYVSQAEEAMVMRLHLREMLEPSSVFREVLERAIYPHHQALVALLARHCGLKKPDTDLHQLAFALVAMAYDYCVSRECMTVLAPDVLMRAKAAEKILGRLVGYSEALLAHEIQRRANVRGATQSKRRKVVR